MSKIIFSSVINEILESSTEDSESDSEEEIMFLKNKKPKIENYLEIIAQYSDEEVELYKQNILIYEVIFTMFEFYFSSDKISESKETPAII